MVSVPGASLPGVQQKRGFPPVLWDPPVFSPVMPGQWFFLRLGLRWLFFSRFAVFAVAPASGSFFAAYADGFTRRCFAQEFISPPDVLAAGPSSDLPLASTSNSTVPGQGCREYPPYFNKKSNLTGGD